MATNTATATVKGGLFETNGVLSLASMSGESGARRLIREIMGDRSMLPVRELFRALTGAVAGTVATKTITRVQASSELGGKRAIETQTLVNRATTAADVTEFKDNFLAMTGKTTYGSSPVANKDGNPLGTR